MLLQFQLLALLSTVIWFFSNALDNNECSKYKSLWFGYKYPYTDGLMKLSPPKSFKNVCPTSTCCDGTMQNEMVAVSKLQLQSIAEKHLQTLSELLLNASTATNDYLITNIDSSRQQLNQMFINTYSSNYKMHQSFFVEFYGKLKQYIDGKQDNLQTILDNFFVDMAERIVSMMVIAKKDPDTVRCLTNNLMKLDPYQGADRTIVNLVINSYPITRMFVNGLLAANDVIMELIKDKTTPSWDCAMLYSKAFYCSLCSGVKAKPCGNVCKSTIGKCFGSFNSKEIARLNKAWMKLIGIIDKLAKKLIHPLNVPEINKNLHVKISDAIMNVHNFFPSAREKIWVNCKSHVNRERRSTDWNSQFQSSQTGDNGQSLSNDIDLSKLIKTFSTKLPDMKTHFKRLKTIICDNKDLSIVNSNDQCWDGARISLGSSTEYKQKRDKQNLEIDAVVKKSIAKLNEISSVLDTLITGQNKDPKAFKIEFVPSPKKPANRQGDDNVSIEGSGETDNVASNNKPVKKVDQSVQSNEEVVDGSGGSNVPAVNNKNATKSQASFPKLPNMGRIPVIVKPDTPVKKPVIEDDEDMTDNPVDNTKNEASNVQIEGSGNKPVEPVLQVLSTAAPIIIRTVPSIIENKPIEGSGFDGSPDDETRKRPVDIDPRFPDLVITTSSTGAASSTSASVVLPVTNGAVMPHQLPGDVPQEIWIPQVMDYDSYGRLVSVTTKRSPTLIIGHWLIIALFTLCYTTLLAL